MRILGLLLILTANLLQAEDVPGVVLPLPAHEPQQAPEAPPTPVPAPLEAGGTETSADRVKMEPKKGPETYDELTLRDGSVYEKCRVIRADPDALLVEHSRGMARLSLFELPVTVQEEWGFDPFKATEHFKAEAARQRGLRWRLFWERQEYESEQARQQDEERLLATAAREWIPVEATVLQRLEDGSLVARCQQVTFKKTKTKSTLGFEIDGPPKRTLVPFGNGPLILRVAVSSGAPPNTGSVWKGFVHPVSEGEMSYHTRGQSYQAPAHAAAPAKP